MKKLTGAILAATIIALSSPSASAIGWPANYEGVMLQGFYWGSYLDENGWGWSKLTDEADEISRYFDLMWLPNAAANSGGEGYHPQFWFSNFNTSYGSEVQYDAMRRAYLKRGVGLIAETIHNHRDGLMSWYEFPVETWRGQTMKIGLEGICRDDELATAAGQPKPTGNYDTGEPWDGARDLDHTNANVQKNCIAWQTMMLEDKGYVGFRLDFVKGYSPYYNKIYNQATRPEFCVGEYWGGYDEILNWIAGCEGESAAFDFPGKYALNDAFNDANGRGMENLVWLADGVTPQPAGLIHQAYNRQLAVTFVDNHDSARDHNAFPNVYRLGAAYAFVLCQPGTPCVSLLHWCTNRDEIKALIDARRRAGITNTSGVEVLKSTHDCYMAQVYGTKGKLVVKIGSDWDSPWGYSDSDIVAVGPDYCVWVQAAEPSLPGEVYLLGNVNNWGTSNGVKMKRNGSTYYLRGVYLPPVSAADQMSYFNLATAQGDSWDTVNGSDRFGATLPDFPGRSVNAVVRYGGGDGAGNCLSWCVPSGYYNISLDLRRMKLIVEPVAVPQHLYIIGNVNGWDTRKAPEFECNGTKWVLRDVTLPSSGGTSTISYFNLATSLGANWEAVNAADRFGAASDNQAITPGVANPVEVVRYGGGGAAGACRSWTAPVGTYDITVDLAAMTLTLALPGEEAAPDPTYTVYFDNSTSNWRDVYAYVWDNATGTYYHAWPGEKMQPAPAGNKGGNGATATHSYTFTTDIPITHIIFSDGNGTQTADLEYRDGAVYGYVLVSVPDHVYLTGTLATTPAHWMTTSDNPQLDQIGNKFSIRNVQFSESDVAFFSFLTATGANWAAVNAHPRIGALTADAPLTLNEPVGFKVFAAGAQAAGAYAWKLTLDPEEAPHGYDLTLDFLGSTLTVVPAAGHSAIDATADKTSSALYFDLAGRPIGRPTTPGLYLRRTASGTTKFILK